MKMNYLPRNRSRSNRHKLVLFLLGVLAFGVLVFYLMNGVFISAAAPLWRMENGLSGVWASATEIWRSRQSLVSENVSLKERLSSLELELAARPPAPEENGAWLALLNREAQSDGLVAGVLVRPPRTPYDILIIDAGEDDGVAAGATVALPEGPVLGVVSEVYGGTSKVKLFSSAGEETSAVLERSGLPVILEGSGGGNFRVAVPRETWVEKGDRILSSDVFARLLAVVEEINVEPTDSFKEVLSRGPANLFNIRFVVIRP